MAAWKQPARKRYCMAPKGNLLRTAEISAKVDKRKNPPPEQLERLRQHAFQPGVSGNPGGRPKEIMASAYRRALLRPIPNDKDGRIYADAVAEKNLALMLKGDIRVTSEVTDRVDGKAPQQVSLSGPNQGPIGFMNMTPEEKQLRLTALLSRQATTGDKDGKRKQR